MKTIVMMSSAAAVAAVAAMVWGAQPARSSQDWLAKAQTEFATKARDAVIQRQAGKDFGSAENQTSVASAEFSTSVAAAPALRTPEVAQAPVAPLTVEPVKNVTVASLPADVVTAPDQPAAPAFNEPVREQAAAPAPVQPDINTVTVTKPAEPVAPQPVIAPMPQVKAEAPAVVAPVAPIAKPAVAESQPRDVAPQKARRVAKSTVSPHASRRPASDSSMEKRGLDALRQRAPEIAAMVSRYM